MIDQSRTWAPLEERLQETVNARHRVVLGAVIEHMRAEAAPDLERLMATMSPSPNYHFWHDGRDVGPEGTAGVRAYYEAFIATQTNILEYAIDRLVLDEHCLVTEGFLQQIYPGAYAAKMGLEIDDASADYLVTSRQLILWPVDEDGLLQGEDSYSSGPASVVKLRADELPAEYIAMVHPGGLA